MPRHWHENILVEMWTGICGKTTKNMRTSNETEKCFSVETERHQLVPLIPFFIKCTTAKKKMRKHKAQAGCMLENKTNRCDKLTRIFIIDYVYIITVSPSNGMSFFCVVHLIICLNSILLCLNRAFGFTKCLSIV